MRPASRARNQSVGLSGDRCETQDGGCRNPSVLRREWIKVSSFSTAADGRSAPWPWPAHRERLSWTLPACIDCCAVSLHERMISRKSGVGCCEMLNLWRLRLVISLIDSLIGTFINQSVLCRRMMGYTSDTDRRLPSPGRRLVADPTMQVKHGRLKVSPSLLASLLLTDTCMYSLHDDDISSG